LRLWSTDPFKPVVKDGKIYARGAEDNGQAIASSMLALRILRMLKVKPRFNFGVVFVSDEEAGSQYGLRYLLDRGLFKPEDLIIVPDSGSPDGLEIEIAEKSVLWLKITTYGKQAHGSTPHKGLNAHRVGMMYALRIDKYLHEKYSDKDPIFTPQESTFEPTRKETNVAGINIIPGVDTIYFDCRILPRYDVDAVLRDVNNLKAEFEEKYGVRIDVEVVLRNDSPPPTPEDSEVVVRLMEAVKYSRGVKPKTVGIGGGTVAALFRSRGIPAAVWSTVDETAHQPNEYAKIENIVADAIVFTLIPLL
jgi:succinyl-diaminopimelate desuccinylase